MLSVLLWLAGVYFVLCLLVGRFAYSGPIVKNPPHIPAAKPEDEADQ
jgi:hypothetical protein